jgi:hypothetical protein
MLTFVVWLLLLVLCWPLALLALIAWPFVWLISLPFRLVGITFEAIFTLLRAILFLPSRVLGGRPGPLRPDSPSVDDTFDLTRFLLAQESKLRARAVRDPPRPQAIALDVVRLPAVSRTGRQRDVADICNQESRGSRSVLATSDSRSTAP